MWVPIDKGTADAFNPPRTEYSVDTVWAHCGITKCVDIQSKYDRMVTVTDHYPNFMEIGLRCILQFKQRKKLKWNVTGVATVTWERYEAVLSSMEVELSRKLLEPIKNCVNQQRLQKLMDLAVDRIQRMIVEAAEEVIGRRQRRRARKPYITPEVLRIIDSINVLRPTARKVRKRIATLKVGNAGITDDEIEG